jgi:hypothetical protein
MIGLDDDRRQRALSTTKSSWHYYSQLTERNDLVSMKDNDIKPPGRSDWEEHHLQCPQLFTVSLLTSPHRQTLTSLSTCTSPPHLSSSLDSLSLPLARRLILCRSGRRRAPTVARLQAVRWRNASISQLVNASVSSAVMPA